MGRTIKTRRMKLPLHSCLLGVLPYIVLSNPQITQSCSGSHCGQNNVGNPAGSIAQNCQGSHCVQNNSGRRRREIVAEILTHVEGAGRQERSAPAGNDHHGGAHHQVNIPGVHVPDVHVPPPQHHLPHHQEQSPQHHESAQHHKRSADPQISQNCAGSHCNQNNLGVGLLGSALGSSPL
eukprot:TRINITY_DN3831_c0_g1_i2.p1 TRINITY_DN3831_c0_g1~~TRINITY_DN3831_c0_g1_i2.p1  ORF type:complete len:205 (+),score=60.62 TRINITY_DN3831_c0_g1_i2:80-616(+)